MLRQEERDAEKDSITLMDRFKNKRKHMFRELNDKQDDDDLMEEYERILQDEIDRIEDELMSVEMKLQDTLTGSTSEFFEKVKGIIELMKSTTQNL